ncbi:hypothetical protein FHX42_001201 [Saccharopolyspora lacisalsi]|uniref:Uncharacterized protein n=1 Tax=Halosaccharopolyspora lacisalsi TaxID=1000566 RepID=A0A839DPF4_9PSEU|nr:hypothetical protein [Halosaccharopolyspora lacisalsi]
MRVRFAAASGSWRALTVSGAGVRLSDADTPHHVLYRMQPAQH